MLMYRASCGQARQLVTKYSDAHCLCSETLILQVARETSLSLVRVKAPNCHHRKGLPVSGPKAVKQLRFAKSEEVFKKGTEIIFIFQGFYLLINIKPT